MTATVWFSHDLRWDKAMLACVSYFLFCLGGCTETGDYDDDEFDYDLGEMEYQMYHTTPHKAHSK